MAGDGGHRIDEAEFHHVPLSEFDGVESGLRYDVVDM